MKKTAAFLMALGLALPAITLAQDSGDHRPPRRDGPPPREFNRDDGSREGGRREARPGSRDGAGDQRGPRREGTDGERRPPMPPLVAALDKNRDGVIDDSEIKDSAASLRKLDKNDDGKLTMEELRPPRPDSAGPRDREQQLGGRRGGKAGPGDGERPSRGPRPPERLDNR